MARSIDSSFYKSKAWKITRDSYYRSQNGLCERCKAQGLISPAYIVHHKIHLNDENVNDPELSLSWDNLECLCQTCHNKTHFGSNEEIKRWEFNKGSLITLE